MRSRLISSTDPDDRRRYTTDLDEFYTRFVRTYDFLVRAFPLWPRWLKQVLSYLQGPRLLEVSFGTGYLLTQYADEFKVCGIDYNMAMVRMAKRNLAQRSLKAALQQADVCHLPYAAGSLNTVVNTMAFSGYPDGQLALSEMIRVLKPGGRLVMLDVNYPRNRNWLGMLLARFWAATGDILRDMSPLFTAMQMRYTGREVGGFGSVHLYIAEKA